jgi:hypothetical protein
VVRAIRDDEMVGENTHVIARMQTLACGVNAVIATRAAVVETIGTAVRAGNVVRAEATGWRAAMAAVRVDVLAIDIAVTAVVIGRHAVTDGRSKVAAVGSTRTVVGTVDVPSRVAPIGRTLVRVDRTRADWIRVGRRLLGPSKARCDGTRIGLNRAPIGRIKAMQRVAGRIKLGRRVLGQRPAERRIRVGRISVKQAGQAPRVKGLSLTI